MLAIGHPLLVVSVLTRLTLTNSESQRLHTILPWHEGSATSGANARARCLGFRVVPFKSQLVTWQAAQLRIIKVEAPRQRKLDHLSLSVSSQGHQQPTHSKTKQKRRNWFETVIKIIGHDLNMIGNDWKCDSFRHRLPALNCRAHWPQKRRNKLRQNALPMLCSQLCSLRSQSLPSYQERDGRTERCLCLCIVRPFFCS